jgi:hypothetical protein
VIAEGLDVRDPLLVTLYASVLGMRGAVDLDD